MTLSREYRLPDGLKIEEDRRRELVLPDLAAVSEGQDGGHVPYPFTTERLAAGTSWYPLASSRVHILESQSERQTFRGTLQSLE